MHETIEALSAYVDGEVSAGERSRIETHLAACADCTSRKALLERASRSLQGLPPLTPTPEESRQIRMGVLARTRRTPLLRGRIRPAWAGAGALALVAAGVFAGVGMLRDGPERDTTTAIRGDATPQAAPTFDGPEDVRSYLATDSGLKRAYESISPSGAGEAGTKGAVPAPQAPDAAGTRSAERSLTTTTPPSPPEATDRAGAPAPAAGGPQRSAGECLAEHQRGQASGVSALLTRAATYEGKPAWLLVYTTPGPSTEDPRRLLVYVVGRADCGLLSYQYAPAP